MELKEISGIGPKILEKLLDKNINSIKSLIEFYPISYQDYSSSELNDKSNVQIIGTVIKPVSTYHGKVDISTYYILYGGIEYKIVAFNQKFLKFSIKVGDEINLKGTYDKNRNQIVQKSFNKISNLEYDTQKIIPVYSKIIGFTNFKINKIIIECISELEDNKYKENLLKIHNPKNQEELYEAKQYLKTCEFEEYYLKLLDAKSNLNETDKNFNVNIDKLNINKFTKGLEFNLTKDQNDVIKNILDSLNSYKKTQSLILGEVGSGKTIVSLIIALAIIREGYQVVIMAPTEVLARQIYNIYKSKLEEYRVDLYVSGMKNKNQINDYISLGISKVIIGTHALLYGNLEFNNLKLAIIDEQQRFGVEQRNLLINKTLYGEYLYLSATPIPRTLAQSVFKVVDIEFIKTKPQNRKKIKTKLFINKNKKYAYEVLEEELKNKNQVYIVVPTIEEGELEGVENVVDVYKRFEEYYGKKYKIACLHGSMRNIDKENIMNDYKNHKYDILIATTVIEVGIDVPNATVMIVLNAEKYGLATLHQLRGRVGRSSKRSYCFLITTSKNIDSHSRLKMLEKTEDGFELAKYDMENRGTGNFFGKNQSGNMGFKLFDLIEDSKIAEKVIEKYEQ